MKSYKCDFCQYDAGPHRPIHTYCETCRACDRFQLKTRMTDIEAYQWKKHILLDEFLNCFHANLLSWQREILHLRIDDRRLYYIMPKQSGRTHFGRLIRECEKLLNPKD